MIVDFRHCAHGGARGSDGIGLVNGDRRRHAFNTIDLGAIHSVKELPGVWAEGLNVASLSFCVERVKNQRAFAGAGNASDD